jgi:hypothetical protein
LQSVGDDLSLMDAIRAAVVQVNHYTAADIPELRTRIDLVGTVPTLQASAALHYDAWEQTVIDYAARRLRQPPTALLPLAIGRATLAVCRAAYEYWVSRADANLTRYLDEAISTVAHGFEPLAPPTRNRSRR